MVESINEADITVAEKSTSSPAGPDAQRQARAREYARLERRLLLADLALGAAILLVMLFGGLSLWLREQALDIAGNVWLAVAIYFGVFGLAYGFLNFPLDYYSGFVLPHRYGLSMQSLAAWLWDQVKGAAIGGVLGLLIIEVVYWLLRTFPNLWWLLAAAFMLFLTVVLANLAPILIYPIFFQFTPVENQELVERLTRLAGRAETTVRGVFSMNMSSKTTAANAALAGLWGTRRIILGDTLYKGYSADEIETILAHELGHHVHGDVWKGIVVQTVGTLAAFYLVHLVLRWGIGVFGFAGPGDLAAFPLLGIVLGVFGLVTMPLMNAYSRWRERVADAYALEMAGNPDAFRSAMIKLADQNLSDAEPERWVELLLYSHPPVGKRVRMAEEFRG
jgi:STE24 endopeptidase